MNGRSYRRFAPVWEFTVSVRCAICAVCVCVWVPVHSGMNTFMSRMNNTCDWLRLHCHRFMCQPFNQTNQPTDKIKIDERKLQWNNDGISQSLMWSTWILEIDSYVHTVKENPNVSAKIRAHAHNTYIKWKKTQLLLFWFCATLIWATLILLNILRCDNLKKRARAMEVRWYSAEALSRSFCWFSCHSEFDTRIEEFRT